MTERSAYLAALGIHGFHTVEPAILAALVTGDPLLMIGKSGTGKTYLLNSLSEALDLEHRHYNASLLSFDDLVGFPYPDEVQGGVRFLETPATIWQAESVLVDEISRCKPEHQNRLFSLVHERRVQGIALPKLRYRWAAMNPGTTDQGSFEDYSGSEPLDPALADRFALFVWAVDWTDLPDEDKRRVADPSGEGKRADDTGILKRQLKVWRKAFLEQLADCPSFILDYVTAVVDALNSAGVRISPRRARLMARSLLAASIVSGGQGSRLFRLILECSLPQVAWGEAVSDEILSAAHRAAWETASAEHGHWIHAFLAEPSLPKKLTILLDRCQDPDEGTQAIAQLIASESRARAAALAFVLYPAAVQGRLPIGVDGVNDLGRLAGPILSVDGEVVWQERIREANTQPPDFARYAQVIGRKRGGRRERARQFFDWCLVEGVRPEDPAALEAAMEACVKRLKRRGLTG